MLTRFILSFCRSSFVLAVPVRAGQCPCQLSEARFHAVFGVRFLNMSVYVKNSLSYVFWKEGGKREGKETGKLEISKKLTSMSVVILIPTSLANVSTFEKQSVETFCIFLISHKK